MPNTIIVSNRLPVKIEISKSSLSFHPSAGGLATGLSSVYKEGSNLWIGWPGVFLENQEDRNLVIEKLENENMHPLFLSKEEIRDFYEGFSNATLWPTFHYFNEYAIYSQEFWSAFQEVNRKFADEVVRCARPGDTIWIHDYQLLLVPQYVRSRLPDSSIGFFQHIPFPSFEVFRLLPWRKELLQGIMGADLVGFHTYDDVRHFVSSVNRIVGISDVNGTFELEDRNLAVDAFPMGIDFQKYYDAPLTSAAKQSIDKWGTILRDQKIILSVDRLDYSKGIPQKLRAFESFLSKNRSERNKYTLVMIVVPSRDKVPKYRELKEQIDEMAGRINARFSDLGWRPVHYFYRSFNIDQLAALYYLSHVAFITPRRDGMNLVCKEYVAAKRDCTGVLILSEMAGASKELYDAILVNPNDVDEMVKALEDAFSMPEEEQRQYIKNMQYILKTYDIHNWVGLFLERLNFLKNQQQNMNLRLIDDALVVRIRRDYRLARNRIILIDLDDLLLEEEMITRYNSRIEKLNQLYEYLTGETRNIVITSSGTDVHTLEHLVGHFSTDLIAEHGAIYREYGQAWNVLEKVSLEWKNEIFSLLEHFVRRTPGSFIEEKEFSLVWHYSKAEKGLGAVRTRELNEHLRFLANSLNLQILEGRRTLEIKTVQIRKGRTIQRWLDKYPYDFVLAIGVGNHLEDVFLELPENSYSIKIGKGIHSHSTYQVPTVHEALLRMEEIWC